MNEVELEDLVTEYLERVEDDRQLMPEDFARCHTEIRERLLRAIRATLEVIDSVSDSAFEFREEVGPYRIIREIGRGGVGVVYEVERDSARYALKLYPMAPLLGKRAMERFQREAQALARFSHPNIVAVRDSGIDGEVPYLVMELIDGPALTEVSDETSARRAAELVRTLADTVHAAHEKGIIHRDLKPQNVMLRKDGEPVLLDFGLIAADDQPSLTATGDLVGTPRYMAPERLEGAQASAASDVYGLGLILFELVTGKPALPQQSRETVMRAVSRGRFPAPRRLNRETPRGLEKIILQSLAMNPKRRFASARDLAEDLQRFLDREPVRARPPGAPVRAVETMRREPLKAAVALLLLALVILGGRALLIRPAPEAPIARDPQAARTDVLLGLERFLDREDALAEQAITDALDSDSGNAIASAIFAALRKTVPDPESPPLVRLLAEGLALFESKATAQARERFELAAEIEPGNLLASIMLGRCAVRENRISDAEREFFAVSKEIPDCYYVADRLGWIYYRLDRYDESVREYRRAVELRSDRADPWTGLAKGLYRLGNIEEGLKAAERAQAVTQGEDLSLMNIHASLLDEIGRRQEAREIFRRILEDRPDLGSVRANLARSFDSDHLALEAEQEYLGALETDPEQLPALLSLVNMYTGASRGSCDGCDAVYALDLDPLAPRRSRGNLREVHRFPGPLGGDQPAQTEFFEYDEGLGGCCGTNFVTRHVDARGNETVHEYDSSGNRTKSTHRIPSIV